MECFSVEGIDAPLLSFPHFHEVVPVIGQPIRVQPTEGSASLTRIPVPAAGLVLTQSYDLPWIDAPSILAVGRPAYERAGGPTPSSKVAGGLSHSSACYSPNPQWPSSIETRACGPSPCSNTGWAYQSRLSASALPDWRLPWPDLTRPDLHMIAPDYLAVLACFSGHGLPFPNNPISPGVR